MKNRILSQYPSTTFSVYEWDDPEGIFLSAVVDTADLEAVKALFLGRMVDMQVDEDMPLFVIPGADAEEARGGAGAGGAGARGARRAVGGQGSGHDTRA